MGARHPVDEFDADGRCVPPERPAFARPDSATRDPQEEFIGDFADGDARDLCATIRQILDDATGKQIAVAIVDFSRRMPLNPNIPSTFAVHDCVPLLRTTNVRLQF
jgi:hypothetical protein